MSVPIDTLLSHHPRSIPHPSLACNRIGDEGVIKLAAALKETKITNLMYDLHLTPQPLADPPSVRLYISAH